MFRWGCSQELVPASVLNALESVRGLAKGRTSARESAPIVPMADAIVEATLPFLPGVVADMVRLQRLTGARPEEICLLRPVDLSTQGEVWEYVPESHKTEHQNRSRVIFLGSRAQAILQPYLLREPTAFCFSPRESEKTRRLRRGQGRKTPLSCGNRPGTNRRRTPKCLPGERYSSDSYRRAIHRACKTANVPQWSPYRLRHRAATEIRRRFGLEAAQVVLGHSRASVTQIYAQRDLAKAAAVMHEVG